MGFFSKKEKAKERCPICGNEMTFFGGFIVSDGKICDDCEKMVRGQFDVSEFWERKWGTRGTSRQDYKLKTFDPLGGMTVADIREMVEAKNADREMILQEVGSTYANVAKVEEWFTIAPKPLEVGIKRSKELKNRIVCVTLTLSGEFKRGDAVVVTTPGGPVETTLLDVIRKTGATPFETELGANIGAHKIEAGAAAWIIVDMTEGIEIGSLIQK